MNLGEGYDPGGWFVAAAACGLVETESLEGAGECEEQQGWSDEDAEVEVKQADGLQKLVGGSHASSFVQKESSYGKLGGIYLFGMGQGVIAARGSDEKSIAMGSPHKIRTSEKDVFCKAD